MNDPFNEEFILSHALMEDIGAGDITASAVIPESHRSEAALVAKETFVLAGLPFAKKVFKLINPELKFKTIKKDGSTVKKGTVIARISGSTRGLLAGERTALNLVQRLSGVATLTQRFVKRVEGLPVKVFDTRKTTPGLRFFEKYAVRMGGGSNHRFGLFDGILIKDNHITAAGGVKKAVRLARKNVRRKLRIEVETRNIKEVREALSSSADIIMLDNMSLNDMKKSVGIIRGKKHGTVIEASGNIKEENIRAVAETGV
ncbi:MAG TPA: carboxylating nicotinate-nucleotide diphosphorylase, partial [Nitrospirae bacterium]|nr:carboxylating nicotinate-nucleotide diphosphorylase [Nitrospirota bacterium]